MLERIRAQQHKNWLQTLGLLGGMLLLMLLVGFLFMGWKGILWAGILGFGSIFLSYQVPTALIMRMHRAQPIQAYQLTDIQHITAQFSKRAGLKYMPKLFYIPNHQVNAFATGSKEDPAIAITYGLLQQLNRQEISAVLAHEISHIKNNDIRLQQIALLMNRFTRTFSLLGQILLVFNFSTIFMGQTSVSWLAILLLIGAPYLANILQKALSRTREFDADLQAAKITGDPNTLADALERLHRLNQRRRNPLVRQIPVWLSTHPQMEDRIHRLRALAPRFKIEFPNIWV
ncbi:MAG: zinc metalloprotease HtpX [Saprospiraceae bacterium]